MFKKKSLHKNRKKYQIIYLLKINIKILTIKKKLIKNLLGDKYGI